MFIFSLKEGCFWQEQPNKTLRAVQSDALLGTTLKISEIPNM